MHCTCFDDLEVKIKLSFFALIVGFQRHSRVTNIELAVKMSACMRAQRACTRDAVFHEKSIQLTVYLTTPLFLSMPNEIY